MGEWWNGLDPINQGFFVAAFLFSVVFVWQLVAAIMGLSGDVDVDFDADGFDISHAVDSIDAFQVLSIRSILAFCTLFSWSGSLYLQAGKDITMALVFSMLWGVAAMLSVAGLLYLLRKMTETGTVRLARCLGVDGTVYLDIPADGTGEIRILVGEVIQNVKARTAGKPCKAGEPITVTKILGPTTVEVAPTSKTNATTNLS